MNRENPDGVLCVCLAPVARSSRVQTPNLIRHVMSRGNARQCIFLDDRDYRHLVHLFGDVFEEFEVRCWNYCLMPNHYHATLQPTRPNLSEAIRRLNSAYALWWNKRHGRVGHVFQGRFKDQIVDRESYLLALTRYVVMNPVRAGLVNEPSDWIWSSYRATIGETEPPAFLDTTPTLNLFGEEDREVLRSRFAVFAAAKPDDTAVDRIRSTERILGSKEFKDQVAPRLTLV